MKKLTSENPITFRFDGLTVLEIGPEGCLAQDVAAAAAVERLGDTITVEDAGPDMSADQLARQGDSAGKDEDDDGPSHDELKARAEELGLKKNGSKDDLKQRIAEEEARLAEVERLAAEGRKIATQEDLDARPELVEAGVNVGDEIEIQVAE